MANGTTADSITNPVYVSLHQGTNQNLSQLSQAVSSSLIQQLAIANASVVASLNSIATAITGVLPQLIGTFSVDAVTGSTAVAQPGILANGFPLITPVSEGGGIVLLTEGLFVASVTAGVGFTVNTVTGTATSPNLFSYLIVNPL